MPIIFADKAPGDNLYAAEVNQIKAVVNQVESTLIPSINEYTSSHSLVIEDAGKLVSQNVATANNVTIPLNLDVPFQIGRTQITVSNTGAGQVTFVPTAGTTINSAGGALKLRVQYSAATLIKTGTDTWLLTGDITV